MNHFYINKLEHPLSPNKINFENLSKFSNYPHSREMDFFELIDPKNHTNLYLACSYVFLRRNLDGKLRSD